MTKQLTTEELARAIDVDEVRRDAALTAEIELAFGEIIEQNVNDMASHDRAMATVRRALRIDQR